jgi:fumarylacetoacetate (FAA) hydrolase family protein
LRRSGRIVGATLGNDVNLRDVEGRSALLLGKAKDNNASASLGPFIRLFDGDLHDRDVKDHADLAEVTGEDGFVLDGRSNDERRSRARRNRWSLAHIGRHHQYIRTAA